MRRVTIDYAKKIAELYKGWCKIYLIGDYVAYFKDGHVMDLFDPDVDDVRSIYNRIYEKYGVRTGDIPVVNDERIQRK